MVIASSQALGLVNLLIIMINLAGGDGLSKYKILVTRRRAIKNICEPVSHADEEKWD
jgi:hypothetical protein